MIDTQKENILIAKLVYFCLLLSFITLLVGGILYLIQHGHDIIHDQTFTGRPHTLISLGKEMLAGLKQGQAESIIQLGLMLVLFAQVLRIFLLSILFTLERDIYFICFSFIVLLVLIYSVFF